MSEAQLVKVAVGDRVDYWPPGSRAGEHQPRLGIVTGVFIGGLVSLHVLEPEQQRWLKTKVLTTPKAGCASPRAGGA